MKYMILSHDLLDHDLPCFELDVEFNTKEGAIIACKELDKEFAKTNNSDQWYSVFIPKGNCRESVWDARDNRQYNKTFIGYRLLTNGNYYSEESVEAKEVHFEGNDLCVVAADGRHFIFKDAQLVGVEYDISDKLTEITPVKFRAIPVVSGVENKLTFKNK